MKLKVTLEGIKKHKEFADKIKLPTGDIDNKEDKGIIHI